LSVTEDAIIREVQRRHCRYYYNTPPRCRYT